MEINKGLPKKEQAQSIYSRLAIARESATITHMWQRLKGRQGTGKLYSREEGSFRGALIGR